MSRLHTELTRPALQNFAATPEMATELTTTVPSQTMILSEEGVMKTIYTIREHAKAFAAIIFSLSLLSGCGGGDSSGVAPTSSDGRMKALSVSPQSTASVVALVKISETRISRTVYDYVFKITVRNGSQPQSSVTATLIRTGVGSSVVDGLVFVGDLLPGAEAVPSDTITIRQDRTIAFDQSALQWKIISAPNDWPVATSPFGVSVSFPPTLSPTIDPVTSDLMLAEPGSGTNGLEFGAVFVSRRANPMHLSIAAFFDGLNDSALGPLIGQVQVGPSIGYLFTPPQSLSADVIVVVPLADSFVVIRDGGAGYQHDDIFDKIISSTKIAI